MTIERYDPLSVSQITQERIEAQNKKTVPTPPRPNTGHLQPIKHTQTSFHGKEGSDLKEDFLNLLMSPEQGTHNAPQTKNTRNKETIRSTNGTKEFFLSHKQCEEKKENSKSNTFSFSIVNSMAGEVQLQGEFLNGRCFIRMALKKDLTVKEKAVLAQILQTSLKNKLNTEVELKID